MSEKRISFKFIKWKFVFYFSLAGFFLLGLTKRILQAL